MSLLPFDYMHSLGALKGWTRGQPIDFNSRINASDLPNAYPGRCVHVDPNGTGYMLGCGTLQMPLFLIRGVTSLDVISDMGASWSAGFPGGFAGALAGTGAYELETTEYDPSLTVVAPNTPLTSPTTAGITAGGGQANAGLLYASKNWAGGGGGALVKGTDPIVGLSSRGIQNSPEYRTVKMLTFWPALIF